MSEWLATVRHLFYELALNDVNMIEILANVVLLTMVGTLMLGMVAYLAYKMRERRKPKAGRMGKAGAASDTPIFFARYVPDPAHFRQDGERAAYVGGKEQGGQQE